MALAKEFYILFFEETKKDLRAVEVHEGGAAELIVGGRDGGAETSQQRGRGTVGWNATQETQLRTQDTPE